MRATDLLKGPAALKATWLGMTYFGRFSQRIGGWFTARLWFTPWRAKLSPKALVREAGWLAQTEPFRVEVDGTALHGFQAGRGPAVLLVHGWGERASTMGAFVAPLVAAGYRVVAIDLPGHGASTTSQTDLLVIANALRETARQAGGVHAVIAHSMGGLATTFALANGL